MTGSVAAKEPSVKGGESAPEHRLEAGSWGVRAVRGAAEFSRGPGRRNARWRLRSAPNSERCRSREGPLAHGIAPAAIGAGRQRKRGPAVGADTVALERVERLLALGA